MYQLNEDIIKSLIFNSFITIKENKELYLAYLNDQSLSNKDKLDEAFTSHTKQILAIAYLKKLIYYESRRFDKKRREFENKQPVILNAPIEEDITMMDTIADENSEPHFQLALRASTIEGVIRDNLLIDAIRRLTDRQREILYYRYVLNWNDTMIAKKYNVSQQAISKSHKKALQKMREVLK